MTYDGEHGYESNISPPIRRQYSAGSAMRHRSSSTTRRLFFFCLASIWGFMIGIVGVLAATGIEGQHLAFDVRAIPSLISALLIAAAGSLVVAAAYKESKRRSR